MSPEAGARPGGNRGGRNDGGERLAVNDSLSTTLFEQDSTGEDEGYIFGHKAWTLDLLDRDLDALDLPELLDLLDALDRIMGSGEAS